MFFNEVPNNADVSAVIIAELRNNYNIKFRKDKKQKVAQVSCCFVLLAVFQFWMGVRQKGGETETLIYDMSFIFRPFNFIYCREISFII